jgi:hypothetical protein
MISKIKKVAFLLAITLSTSCEGLSSHVMRGPPQHNHSLTPFKGRTVIKSFVPQGLLRPTQAAPPTARQQ